MTNATLVQVERPMAFDEDDFAPLDVRVVVAEHPYGKLMCSTGDGCGPTCQGGASACNSFVGDSA
ncbi:FxLD family lanthipeptide [Streptomyces sp. NPDC005963]|uniref:FxLD family lanthipeptide n=1 Tax=Streptomyces sp. NPDC005963 TaxID=3156721 RepID=UPI0033E7526E